jgi:cation:H+ antiporter
MDLTTSLLFAFGFVLLVAGAELLVRGASRLAITAGISPLVVGLTVVAYGTSSPELAVTIQSAYLGQTQVAVGNVVGSNIANILLVLGLSAAVAALYVVQKLVRVEVPLMIGLSFLVLLMGLDGKIGWLDGLLLTMGAVAYTTFVIRQSRQENQEIRVEYAQEFDGHAAETSDLRQIALQLGFIVVGVVMLVFGSRWLVAGAVTVARLIGVSELIIGLTIIAVGTSLPEIATSVVAAIRGERDIAVGNVVGSNIFNILLVLGVGGMVAADGLVVAPAALRFDIPVMIAVAIACLPIFFTGYRIDRWEGVLFLGYYAAYTVYLYLRATQHEALPTFSTIMAVFVLPLTTVTLLIVVIRNIQTNRQRVAVKGSSPT